VNIKSLLLIALMVFLPNAHSLDLEYKGQKIDGVYPMKDMFVENEMNQLRASIKYINKFIIVIDGTVGKFRPSFNQLTIQQTNPDNKRQSLHMNVQYKNEDIPFLMKKNKGDKIVYGCKIIEIGTYTSSFRTENCLLITDDEYY